jgi:hypothetical protein
MKAYKGFDKDFKCRDFQYEVGQSYTFDGKTSICFAGFHACVEPIDVLRFYCKPGSKYAVVDVEQTADISHLETEFRKKHLKNDSKIVGDQISIEKEITIDDLIQEQVKRVAAHSTTRDIVVTDCANIVASDNDMYKSETATSISKTRQNAISCSASFEHALAVSTGTRSISASNSAYARSFTLGDQSIAVSPRASSRSTCLGDVSIASATGSYSCSKTYGEYSVASSVGYQVSSAAYGDKSVAVSVGDAPYAIADGKDSIAVAYGNRAYAQGSLGSYIVIAYVDKETGEFVVKSAFVDGEKIKADTIYSIRNGEFVEMIVDDRGVLVVKDGKGN